MKKLILSVVVLSFIAYSCKKEEIVNPNNSKTTNPSMLNDGANTDPDDMPKWEDNGAQPGHDGIDYGCFWMYGNCLPTITIEPCGINNVFDNIIDDINNNSGNEVINIFTLNSSDLSEILGTEIVNSVISGAYELNYRGENISGNNLYFLFSANNEIVLVKPMSM